MNEANEKHLIELLDSIDTHLDEIRYELGKMREVREREERDWRLWRVRR